MRSGVAHFIHVGQMSHGELAASFVMAAAGLIRFREKHGRPFIAKVYRPVQKTPYRTVPGDIRMVLTLAEWEAQHRG
jgi:hypothetical protein